MLAQHRQYRATCRGLHSVAVMQPSPTGAVSLYLFEFATVPASVIHVSCLTNRGRWKVFFMIKVITSLVLVKGVIDEFVQNTKIKVIYREWHYSYSVVHTMERGRFPAPY